MSQIHSVIGVHDIADSSPQPGHKHVKDGVRCRIGSVCVAGLQDCPSTWCLPQIPGTGISAYIPSSALQLQIEDGAVTLCTVACLDEAE